MAALLGNMEQFDLKSEDWREYTERLEQYFLANDIDEKKQTAVFLTVIGPETYGLLRNLLAPIKPSTKSVGELVHMLDKHLNPTPITIAERFKFYQRQQKEEESLGDYLAALRKLSEHCNFETFLEEAIRDKLVCGILNNTIRKKLLSERNLTLQRAIEIAKGLEEADIQSKTISEQQQNIKEETSYKIIPKRYTPPRKIKSNKKCYRCNDPDHMANVCPFKHLVCDKCNVKGHVGKACKKFPESKKRTHQIDAIIRGEE